MSAGLSPGSPEFVTQLGIWAPVRVLPVATRPLGPQEWATGPPDSAPLPAVAVPPKQTGLAGLDKERKQAPATGVGSGGPEQKWNGVCTLSLRTQFCIKFYTTREGEIWAW